MSPGSRLRLPLLRLALAAAALAGLPPAHAQAPDPAPGPVVVTGSTPREGPVDLAALRGRVVPVYLWSTDCPVCLRQLPELRRNLQGWKGRAFTVVAVNMDRDEQALRDYQAILDRVAPPSPQMRMLWRGADGYHDNLGPLPMNTPTSLVLDRGGAAVARLQGAWTPELWDRMADLVVE